METRLGTCGWSFPDWKGTFYPPGTKGELAYYASRFDAVGYRPPAPQALQPWDRDWVGYDRKTTAPQAVGLT